MMMRKRVLYVLLAILVTVALGATDARGDGRRGHPGREGANRAGLAFQLLEEELVALRGAQDGGLRRTSGGRLQALPVIVRGLPGPLSGLVEQLIDGRRFGGRVFQVSGSKGQVVLEFSTALATAVDLPAVGPDADPFVVGVTIEPDEADLGPFATQEVTRPSESAPFEPELELAAGSLDVVTPIAAEPARVARTSGGRLQASNLRVTVSPEDLAQYVDTLTGGRRLGDVRLSYLRRGGESALDITGETGRVVAVEPAYTDGGGVVEIELNDPTVTF